ncbi:MAG: acetolactate synthase small subunit [Myxococcota bacterium]
MNDVIHLVPPRTKDRRVLSVLVENRHGVLSRASGMFAARGYNIDSLTVSPTEDPSMSRMTVCLGCDDNVIEQIRKQLAKMTEVIVIEDVTERPHVERELVLLKVRLDPSNRSDLLNIAAIFKAKSVDMTPDTITFEIVGSADKLSNFINMILQDAEVVELARSGVVAVRRGSDGLRESFSSGVGSS